MRLKVREMVLSDGTSKRLRQDMSEKFGGSIDFNTVQKILDSDNYEIRKTDHKLNPYSSLYYESIVINRNFDLGIITNGEFKPLYNLYPDKEGILYQIFEEDYKMNQINGNYLVIYKSPRTPVERVRGSVKSNVFSFTGECESFTTDELCIFRNEDKELLLVDYQDIVQLQPLND